MNNQRLCRAVHRRGMDLLHSACGGRSGGGGGGHLHQITATCASPVGRIRLTNSLYLNSEVSSLWMCITVTRPSYQGGQSEEVVQAAAESSEALSPSFP